MIQEIWLEPSAILGRVMPEVKNFGPGVAITIHDLQDTMIASNGVGLAANQIGVELAICVIKILDSDRDFAFVNPKIVWREGRVWSPESCLSIPEYSAIIPRSQNIRLTYQVVSGQTSLLTLGGVMAIRAQHEIDHLNGILISDYVEGKKGKKGGINATEGVLID
jgi:peptide deformylase